MGEYHRPGYKYSKQTSMTKCVFCGESATKMNKKDQPVCRQCKDKEPREVGCEDCGMPMQVKEGSNGFFWGCQGYPSCQNTHSIGDKIEQT